MMSKPVVAKAFLCFFLATIPFLASAQKKLYSPANAHSHNDYLQAKPFSEAYGQNFGSIEVDVVLLNGQLLAAHSEKDIKPDKTIQSLYLAPMLSEVTKNKGKIYPRTNAKLQLLIDLKTESEPTMNALVKVLEGYPELINKESNISFVISGNVPSPDKFSEYPDFIFFDGRPEKTYTPEQLARIGLISQAWHNYSLWNGIGSISKSDKADARKVVEAVHALGKPMRFWASPDTQLAWYTLIDLGVDYINTDKVTALGKFTRSLGTR